MSVDSSFQDLAKLTLAQIILFNRKRSGEAQRITVGDYRRGLKCDDEVAEEVKETLSKFELHLLKNLERIEIRGKRGRRVAILLTSDLVEKIDWMMEIRIRRCVEVKDTEYLFAKLGQATPYRGHIVLKEAAVAAGCKFPDRLTSTSLRKHLATMSQVLHADQDTLADFMGHDIRVHREFYRLPLSTVQKAKVSKVLVAINKGSKLSEVNFDDIEVNCQVEDESESENDTDNDEDGNTSDVANSSCKCILPVN